MGYEGNYNKPVVNAEVPVVYDTRQPSRFYFKDQSTSFFYWVLPLMFLGGTVLSVILFLQLLQSVRL